MVKTRTIVFRVTDEQYFLMRLWARQEGLGVSSYARVCFFGKNRAEARETAAEGTDYGH